MVGTHTPNLTCPIAALGASPSPSPSQPLHQGTLNLHTHPPGQTLRTHSWRDTFPSHPWDNPSPPTPKRQALPHPPLRPLPTHPGRGSTQSTPGGPHPNQPPDSGTPPPWYPCGDGCLRGWAPPHLPQRQAAPPPTPKRQAPPTHPGGSAPTYHWRATPHPTPCLMDLPPPQHPSGHLCAWTLPNPLLEEGHPPPHPTLPHAPAPPPRVPVDPSLPPGHVQCEPRPALDQHPEPPTRSVPLHCSPWWISPTSNFLQYRHMVTDIWSGAWTFCAQTCGAPGNTEATSTYMEYHVTPRTTW